MTVFCFECGRQNFDPITFQCFLFIWRHFPKHTPWVLFQMDIWNIPSVVSVQRHPKNFRISSIKFPTFVMDNILFDRTEYRVFRLMFTDKSECTYVKDTVKWNLCLRPLKVMKDCPGKLRVVISQYGFSYSPGGHSHIKPPASRFTHLPPFLHTPGTHRPDEALSSQCSPEGE